MHDNECTTLLLDVNDDRGLGPGHMELSPLLVLFCCEPETALQNKVFLKTMQSGNCHEVPLVLALPL